MTRYRFGQEVGVGSYGRVCAVTCIDDGWVGVAKRLREPYSDEELARFKREVRLQAQLHHQNVLRIRAMNLDSDPPWFAMPRAPISLRRFLEDGNAGERHLHLWLDIAAAVEYAHRNGIIHRDLKPENVLLFDESDDDDYYAVVGDFGLGRHIDRATLTLTRTAIGMGTLAYAAPEQLDDAHSADARSDIFSLGKMLYELLTNRIPFLMLDYSRVPAQFRYIVQRATDMEPERRYQTVTAMLSDIEVLGERTDDLQRPETTLFKIFDRYAVPRSRIRPSDIHSVVRLFVDNSDDYTLMVRALPKVPEPLLTAVFGTYVDAMYPVLAAYDQKLDEGLTFEYCDVVAEFYDRLFDATEDLRVRRLVLHRLATLGHQHNRWHVGRVFARVLRRVTDPGLIVFLRDALSANPAAANWLTGYVSDVPPILRSLLSTSP